MSKIAAERMYNTNFEHIVIPNPEGKPFYVPKMTDEEEKELERRRNNPTEKELEEEYIDTMECACRDTAIARVIKEFEKAAHAAAHRIAEDEGLKREQEHRDRNHGIDAAQRVFMETYAALYPDTYEKIYNRVKAEKRSELYQRFYEEEMNKVGLDKDGNKLP